MRSNIRVSIHPVLPAPEAEVALQVTRTNRGEGQKSDPKKTKPKKHLRIYSKIFLLKKLISTIFLQEKKV